MVIQLIFFEVVGVAVEEILDVLPQGPIVRRIREIVKRVRKRLEEVGKGTTLLRG